MNPSDEPEDRELLERYRRASGAEPLTPRDAVRSAILDEGRRAAASFAAEKNRRRPSRWKMTAFATAATVLLASLVIAPRLLQHERQVVTAGQVAAPNQAAERKVQPDAFDASTPAVPAAPVQAPPPVPKAAHVVPFPNAPVQRQVPAPPPIDHPEERAETSMMDETRNLAQSRSAAAPASVSAFAGRIRGPSESLPAAVSTGDLAKVTLLLDEGKASVDERDGAGRTPLMIAVDQGRLDMVRLLLGRGADPNAADKTGLAPLELARQRGQTEIANALTQAGAR
jgi:Ankyrin repeats (many copies)